MVRLCFIRREYFEIHRDFVKMLDIGNPDKQSHRTHLCVHIVKADNNFFIPLRNNLGEPIRKYGRIGHAIPSEKREKAGLDFRYAILVNDEEFIENITEKKIPKRQMDQLEREYDKICNEFSVFLNGFIKAAKRGQAEKIPLYRESSLINFVDELI